MFTLIFSYAENARIISDRFRDQLRTPLETGIHWVKHVAKNKGAPHLRSHSVDLPFYQLHNLDVWAFIIAVLALFVLIITKILSFFIGIVFSSSSKKTKHE